MDATHWDLDHETPAPVEPCRYTLDLFAPEPTVLAPAPSAPGSESSELASEAISGPFRQRSMRLIMLHLATLPASETRSRAEIAEATGLPINIVCARVSDLVGYVEIVKMDRVSSAKPDLRVDGVRLSAAGRERVRKAAP